MEFLAPVGQDASAAKDFPSSLPQETVEKPAIRRKGRGTRKSTEKSRDVSSADLPLTESASATPEEEGGAAVSGEEAILPGKKAAPRSRRPRKPKVVSESV